MARRSKPLQTLSVKDIAQRVRRPGEELQVTVDRLRNWTDQNLIHQVGAKNPGKGRARRYGRNSLLDAALLDALTSFGIPAVHAAAVLPETKKLIAGPWEKAGQLQPGPPLKVRTYATSKGSPDRNSLDRPVLVLSKSTGKGDTRVALKLLKELTELLQPERYDGHIVIDLQLMFERLLRPLEEI